MQRLEGLLRKAVQDYEMIAPGDRVCVGVSGGKDSVALTVALGHLRRYLGVPFEVMAVTLDPRFGGVEADYQPLADLFAQEGIPYEIRRTDIGPVVFDYRKEPNPCALCANHQDQNQMYNLHIFLSYQIIADQNQNQAQHVGENLVQNILDNCRCSIGSCRKSQRGL